MTPFSYQRPERIDQAIALHGPDSRYIAGGTNLLDLMKENVLHPGQLIDINGLPLREIEQPLRRIIRAQRARNPGHRFRRRSGVVGGRMRQHDRMGFGMGQVEHAAQHVTELVMQRHPDRAEADAAQPGAVERVAPRARIEVNAAWPGVSRKVSTAPLSVVTW